MNETSRAAIPTRRLGSTGEAVSLLGVGGSHLVADGVDEALAIRIVRSAVDRGITFLDNSWDYGEGEAERRMGKALRDGYRERAFLMTKIDGRSRESARRQLEESLDRLGVDRIDLVQHHEVIRYEDADRIFRDDGANAALVAAREEGLLRYIGFTGHKDPRIHLYTLDVAREHGFRFDTVQMPLNVMDAAFRSFEQRVLPRLVEEEIAVLGMKSMGSGVILEAGAVSAEDCLRYALSLPTAVVITGMDSMERVDQAVRIGTGFTPLDEERMRALRELAAPYARSGEFELFKTSTVFDATAQNPRWLGEEPERIRQATS